MGRYRSNNMRYPFMAISWKDAESDCEWKSECEVEKWLQEDCIIHEIGWLISQNKKYIVLSNQIAEDGTIGNRTKIPAGWIIKRKRIKLP